MLRPSPVSPAFPIVIFRRLSAVSAHQRLSHHRALLLASQPEASLAGMVATSKPRQQVLKPCGGLDMKVRGSLRVRSRVGACGDDGPRGGGGVVGQWRYGQLARVPTWGRPSVSTSAIQFGRSIERRLVRREVRPVRFPLEASPRSFILLRSKERPPELIAAVYRIEAIRASGELSVHY